MLAKPLLPSVTSLYFNGHIVQDERPLRAALNVIVQGYDASIIPTFQVLQWLQSFDLGPLGFCKKAMFDRALTHQEAGHNLVPTKGLNQIVDLIIGASSTSISYCGVGTGSTSEAATDTDLATPLGTRHSVNSRSRGATGVANFITFFEALSTWNGTWSETGLFKDSTTSGTDVMLARKVLSGTYSKTTSNTASIAWSLTFIAS